MATKIKATKAQIIRDAQRAVLLVDGGTLTRDFLRSHSVYSDKQRAAFFPTHESLLAAAGITEKTAATPAEKLAMEQAKQVAKSNDGSKVLGEAVKKIAALENEKAAILNLKDRTPQLTAIDPQKPSGDSESVAFMIMSDWHSEEEVLPGQVGGLNTHNLSVGARRAENAWRGCQRFYDIFQTRYAHWYDCARTPRRLHYEFHSRRLARSLIYSRRAMLYIAFKIFLLSGIRFLLDNTTADLLIVCHSGNHGRTTKEQRIATETGNSLEQYLYYNMRDQLANEPRVKFQIAEGYHSYVRLFDNKYVVRFHHGHGMNYGGGIGGIMIPVQKAINQWNKGVRADLDVFGHFHTRLDGGNFVANGSLIGYNAYALRIKADFERPSQTFFLVNKKYRSKGVVTPIFVD